jgi:DNA-binding transcriptional MerR regulator
LTPSRTEENGYRRYRREDLLRLQQIVTLKWMGFSLEQIGEILNRPSYDLKQALAAQKEAVEAQIEQLMAAAVALRRAIDAGPDAGTLQTIIHAVQGNEPLMRYYDKAALAGINLRRMAYSAEEMEAFQQEWMDLYAELEQQRDKAAGSPELQALAARADRLITLFTAGDEQVEAGLRRMADDERLGVYRPYAGLDEELQTLMQEAMAIYRRKKNDGH